jgi:signal peptidase I
MNALVTATKTVAVTALAVIGALMLVPMALGYRGYVVDGGSMGTAIPRGSVVFDEQVQRAQLRVGDVVTYTPPGRGRVTHRIVALAPDGSLRTKGDANAAADPWTAKLTASKQARVAFHIPFAGYVYAALGLSAVRMAVIGLPALLIAIGALRRAVRA